MLTGTLKEKESKPNDQNIPRLSDLDLSRSLEYIFKKTTQEVLSLHKKAEVEKIGIVKDDILYCKSRMLEGGVKVRGWFSSPAEPEESNWN